MEDAALWADLIELSGSGGRNQRKGGGEEASENEKKSRQTSPRDDGHKRQISFKW